MPKLDMTDPAALRTAGVSDPGPKSYRRGTHRVVHPDVTLETAAREVHRAGITRVANVTGLDRLGIPVVVAVRPASRSLSVSQGKGMTHASARASAVMEALESYHAERPALDLRLARHEELSAVAAVADPELLPRLARSLYRPDLPILWTAGTDLLGGGPVWVPYELVHTDWTVPLPAGSGCFWPTSNGLASGNHRLEAIGHAVCEVVERDAAALWQVSTGRHRDDRALAVDTVTCHDCREVIDRVRGAGLDLRMWDMTTDTGIASFVCSIAETDPGAACPSVLGMGAHPDRAVALLRALTEAAQTRVTVISGSRDDLFRSRYRHRHDAGAAAASPPPSRRFGDAPTFESDTLADDLRWELERLVDVGIRQVIAVDLTGPEADLPVVRVIVPGLEGYGAPGEVEPGPRARRAVEAAAGGGAP